jgi:hypothetical protein
MMRMNVTMPLFYDRDYMRMMIVKIDYNDSMMIIIIKTKKARMMTMMTIMMMMMITPG